MFGNNQFTKLSTVLIKTSNVYVNKAWLWVLAAHEFVNLCVF